MRHISNYNFILLIAASMAIMNRPAMACDGSKCPLAHKEKSSGAGSTVKGSGGMPLHSQKYSSPKGEFPTSSIWSKARSNLKIPSPTQNGEFSTGIGSRARSGLEIPSDLGTNSQNPKLDMGASLGSKGTDHFSSSNNIGNVAFNNGNSRMDVGNVEKLTNSNMNELMKSGTWIVRYFRSDCPQNANFEAAWNKLLQEYSNNGIHFATADCNVELHACAAVLGVPAYIAYKDGRLLKKHEVNRYDYEDLKPFFDGIISGGNGQLNGMDNSQNNNGLGSLSSSSQFGPTSQPDVPYSNPASTGLSSQQNRMNSQNNNGFGTFSSGSQFGSSTQPEIPSSKTTSAGLASSPEIDNSFSSKSKNNGNSISKGSSPFNRATPDTRQSIGGPLNKKANSKNKSLRSRSRFGKTGSRSLKTEKGSVALTSKNKDLVSKGKWIVYYSKPTCPYCVNYQPTWNQRVQTHQDKGFQYATVNCQTSPELCEGILGVPALFEFNDGKKKPINQ